MEFGVDKVGQPLKYKILVHCQGNGEVGIMGVLYNDVGQDEGKNVKEIPFQERRINLDDYMTEETNE